MHNPSDSTAPADAPDAPPKDMAARQRQCNRIVNAGLAGNILLALLKTATGLIGNSQALLADGINSTSDVVYYVVVKIFMRLSHKPPDDEHPYGHHQLESIAALVVGAFVVTTGVAVFWDSLMEAFHLWTGRHDGETLRTYTIWVALATIAIKLALASASRKVGRATNHVAILALASDHRNDVFAALGVAIGIAFTAGGWRWVDPAAGAVVAGLILKTGISILRDSSADLMDTLPGRALQARIEAVAGAIPGVVGIESVDAHRFGPYLVANITIAVDGGMSVAAGDRIATTVERRLCDAVEYLRRVYVHIHPARPLSGGGTVGAPL